ncbi:MAG: hypothetical protein JWP00_1170 [Chloroflexi bacterium]|jgi:hypothetical protein|nr:hypothetical protein [Chloroflexota bacterium]
MDKQVEGDKAQDPRELSAADLEAEEVAELPDREALSLISPDGFSSIPAIGPAPPEFDTLQPVPADRI